MKITKRITNLLMDGKPRTAEEIYTELGLTSEQLRSAMNPLRKHAAIKRTPITYVLTEVGRKHATKAPAREEQARIRHNQQQAAYRERVRLKEEARRKPVVDQALRARPPLESAWGGARA